MKHKTYIYVLIFFSMLFWGCSFIWSKIVFNYYNPITTIFLRLVLSTIILYTGLKIFNRTEKIYMEDIRLFLLSALFNPFIYFLGENYGLKFSTPSICAVVIATIPLFTTLMARFMLKEKLPFINILGILLSFSGIVLMLVNKDLSLNASPLGIVFLLVAVMAAASYSILLKKLTYKYSAFTIILIQNFIGILYFLPFFLIFELRNFLTVKPNAELISSLLMLAIFASSLAFVFFAIAVREIGVSRTNVFSNTIPVFTAIFSYFILSEYFSFNKIAGMIIVVAGVMLTQLNKLNKLNSP
ncbi:MAG: DMT family transporter [Bacteroidetes bacterium]|nr:DMT family transporter [Bacteroidota bacterium]